MRADRGFLCMNEVDLFRHGPVTPGLFPGADHKVTALLRSKLSPLVVRDMMLTGRRYTGAEATALGIVDAAEDEEALLGTAVR
jgi:enoyl-CoA hydratase/carnithine racemase